MFAQLLRLSQKDGMVSLEHLALDSTKVQANASNHKAMSHQSPEFKARIAIEDISGIKMIQEIAAEHAIHPIKVSSLDERESAIKASTS
jgi:hypothetical protein